MSIKRYSIYWVCLDPTLGGEMKKTRPAVVVSQDAMNEHLSTVVICPLTSSIHLDWRSRIQISCAGKPSEIAVDQIRTVDKNRLSEKIDSLSVENIDKLQLLITEMYGSGCVSER